jgi:hypothetical protein
MELLPAEWRNYLLGFKRFRAKNRVFPPPMLIFFTEKGKWHGGFADRIKGIVSLFHYCLCKNIPFKINYTFPFELSDFLQPNEYNWEIDKNEISFNRKEAKLFLSIIVRFSKAERLLKLNANRQIHAFCRLDYVEEINSAFKTNYTWGELYKKLFKPTEKLQNTIDKHLKTIEDKYVCAVFRFQNLLGDFKEYDYKPLSEIEKENLIAMCKKSLLELQQNENINKILVTADSETFLKRLQGLENIFVFPSKVVHIDCAENESTEVYLKSFLDFYLISEAQKVYSVGTKEMYKSEFPMYAAKVNNRPFERILIE